MKKTIYLLISLLIFHVAVAQKSRSSNKFKVICQLKTSHGKYLGTVLCKTIRDSLYSDIMIIRKNRNSIDTLYKLLKQGLYRREGWGESVGQYYSGYGFELLKSDRFTWWMWKENGPSSDGQIIFWNDAKRIFEVDNEGY